MQVFSRDFLFSCAQKVILSICDWTLYFDKTFFSPKLSDVNENDNDNDHDNNNAVGLSLFEQVKRDYQKKCFINKNLHVIAFVGAAGSGKSTAKNYLTYKYTSDTSDFVHLSFAGPLKLGVQSFYDFEDSQLYDTTRKEQVDAYWNATPRYLFQIFGTEIMRKIMPIFAPSTICEKSHWIKRMHKSFQIVNDNASSFNGEQTYVIIDDLRFADEYEYLQQFENLTVIKIERDETKNANVYKHASEQGFAMDPNYIIYNKEDMKYFESELEYCFETIVNQKPEDLIICD